MEVPSPAGLGLKDNSSLLADKRVVSTGGGLLINDVASKDDGNYTCAARNIRGVMTSLARLTVQVGALIIQKPSSVIVEEGHKVTLVCLATGQPTPKADEKQSVTCQRKDQRFLMAGSAKPSENVLLSCKAHGARVVVWQRTGQGLPAGHVVYLNGSGLCFLKNVSPNDAGTYTCIVRSFYRSITAITVLEVRKLTSCSEIKAHNGGISSGTYTIDPDDKGSVTPFSVYCDVTDKGGVGVTVISHDIGALIIQKPSSVIVEEGHKVTLVCLAPGHPTPTITWRKAVGGMSKERSRAINGRLEITNVTKTDGGDYICLAKNIINEDSAHTQVIVLEKLKFTLFPPLKRSAKPSGNVLLICKAQGEREIVWQRTGQGLPSGHVVYSNGSLLLKNVSPTDAGTYTCIERNFHRYITAITVLEVRKPTSCSEIKAHNRGISSGTYTIHPDGKEGVTPFSVYCDMTDKGGVGVTVISHYSERRTYVRKIPGCGTPGCYSKDVRYTGVSTAQLSALTRVSQNCEQFIKFECNNDIAFIEDNYAWNTDELLGRSYSGGGWREDSGLLTDKSVLPVTQIRLGDFDDSREEGYHTLGKLKCYGVA
ncbi:Peroxidasin-like [Stylophora pistillata]|uniref:Peroxidasin-like n=1 Tax=Stylophora pistillata TaxID=50429 RepID=A0A2B4RSY6_STYPI|nr:Peroxidasin-like [Stylophora pistillata]